jgi:hypothetical protein
LSFPLVNYLPVAPVHEPECQLVNHVALVQLDSVDTEPMDACNALTAPSEGVRRSARASGHLLRGIAGLREPTVRWSATRRGQRLSTAPPMIGESDSWMTQAGDARTLTGPVCHRWSVWSTARRAAGG